MNFNTTLYTGSTLFTMNRNKFDFSDEQLIVYFYNYAYCVREIAMVWLIEYCRYVSKNTNRLVNSNKVKMGQSKIPMCGIRTMIFGLKLNR